MPEPTTTAKIVSETERTTCPDKRITKVIVDPGYDNCISMDLEKRASGGQKAPPNVRHLLPEERKRVLAEHRLQQAVAPVRVGTPADTIDGSAHDHPAALLPQNVVAPPQVRVHFDIPGYASMSFRYHAVKRVPGFLVFVTDARYAGGADFHPYTSRLGGGSDQPMGAYVENGKKLYLLKPGSVVFRHEPFEFCLVPIAEERALPPNMGGQEELTSELPVMEDQCNGEEGSDRERADAPRDENPGNESSLVDRLDFRAGGAGGVL